MRFHYQQNDAYWAVVTQAVMVLIVFPLVWGFYDGRTAGSMLTGGLVCVLPNIYLYRRVFAFFGATQSQLMIKALYWGSPGLK